MLRFVDGRVKERFGDRWGAERTAELDEPFARVAMDASIAERVRRSGEEGLRKTPFDGRLDEAVLADDAKLAALCEEVSPKLSEADRKTLEHAQTRGERIYALFELLVEPDIEALFRSADGSKSLPVFVTRFPFEVSPLARKSDDDPAFTDRFEIFVEGRELANGFSELNDPDDQAARFRAQLELQAGGDEEAMDFDEDYIRALMHGMPPAAGLRRRRGSALHDPLQPALDPRRAALPADEARGDVSISTRIRLFGLLVFIAGTAFGAMAGKRERRERGRVRGRRRRRDPDRGGAPLPLRRGGAGRAGAGRGEPGRRAEGRLAGPDDRALTRSCSTAS